MPEQELTIAQALDRQIDSKLKRLEWLEEQFRLADCWKTQERYLSEASKIKAQIEDLREYRKTI